MESETVSLVLPVHNEADNIETVIRSFYREIGSRVHLQIVVAEDGSNDGTKEILNKLSQEIPMVVLTDDKRLGYTGGVIRGIYEATGEYVLFCDSDGQHIPSDFFEMYKEMKGYDMVDGWRADRADTFFRRTMSSIFQALARILFGLKALRDITAPYRLVRRDVAIRIANQVKYMGESFWTEFTIRAAISGAKIKEIPVKHKLRLNGETVVYKPKRIPKIVYSQFKGILKLWIELKEKSDRLLISHGRPKL